MSNRQERRNRKEAHLFVDEHGARLITTEGQKVEVTGERLAAVARGDALDDVKPGEHLWVSMIVFRVAQPERWETDQQHMDAENMVHVTPPGCFVCEQPYSAAVATLRCPGEPS
jgi:hypothetical protein